MEFKNFLSDVETPAYYYDMDEFGEKISRVKKAIGDISLTYSIKANSFLLHGLPENIDYVEVCSPGELAICKRAGIPGDRIIYSGVNKEKEDVTEALEYGVSIATAESIKHVELEQKAASVLGKKQKVILRLTSGNQFGMSKEDIFRVLENSSGYSNLEFYGIHYYSGTQKKTRSIKKDLELIDGVLEEAKERFGFTPVLVEYGPGLAVDYFSDSYEVEEQENLNDLKEILESYSDKYNFGIELGRFLASSCGYYATKVVDLKENNGVEYAIVDGGIHHLKYYGQTMAMKIPPIDVLNGVSDSSYKYCICGSLCTVADVLVREVSLPEINEGTVLVFKRCGAYSITESISTFLSRKMPKVYVYRESTGPVLLRDVYESDLLNF